MRQTSIQTTINTFQNIDLNYNFADVLKRIIARLIDYLIIGLYIIFIMKIMPDNNNNDDSIYFVWFVVSSPVTFYGLYFPYFTGGQTLGKIIFSITIIKEDGTRMDFSNYLIRWLLTPIDSLFNGLVGIITMSSTKKFQRIADLLAKTVVISTKQKISVDHTILAEVEDEYYPVFMNVLKLTDKDVHIIKDNFEIGVKNKNIDLIKKIRNKIEHVIQEFRPEMTDYAYINTVIKDYQYYSQQ